jgi:hypothetical protein
MNMSKSCQVPEIGVRTREGAHHLPATNETKRRSLGVDNGMDFSHQLSHKYDNQSFMQDTLHSKMENDTKVVSSTMPKSDHLCLWLCMTENPLLKLLKMLLYFVLGRNYIESADTGG